MPQWHTDETQSVAHTKGPGTHGAVIFFSGYGAKLTHGKQWAKQALKVAELAQVSAKVWVFMGPSSVTYVSKHLPTDLLATTLKSLPPATPITVISHSSGAYVADSFVTQAKKLDLGPQLHIYTLDGIYRKNLENGVASSWGVWAKEPSGVESFNAPSMKRYRNSLKIQSSSVSCTTRWCLHFATITTHPVGDLALDYSSPSILGKIVKPQ